MFLCQLNILPRHVVLEAFYPLGKFVRGVHLPDYTLCNRKPTFLSDLLPHSFPDKRRIPVERPFLVHGHNRDSHSARSVNDNVRTNRKVNRTQTLRRWNSRCITKQAIAVPKKYFVFAVLRTRLIWMRLKNEFEAIAKH